MEYKIVLGRKLHEIVENVNAAIKEGWKLQGGTSVGQAKGEDGVYVFDFVQAMIKE
jgi:hypothetical protein